MPYCYKSQQSVLSAAGKRNQGNVLFLILKSFWHGWLNTNTKSVDLMKWVIIFELLTSYSENKIQFAHLTKHKSSLQKKFQNCKNFLYGDKTAILNLAFDDSSMRFTQKVYIISTSYLWEFQNIQWSNLKNAK